jgi:hypothetical protein
MEEGAAYKKIFFTFAPFPVKQEIIATAAEPTQIYHLDPSGIFPSVVRITVPNPTIIATMFVTVFFKSFVGLLILVFDYYPPAAETNFFIFSVNLGINYLIHQIKKPLLNFKSLN